MKLIVYLALILLCMSANGADWGMVKTGPGGNTVDLKSPQKEVGLIWPSIVSPGEELLLSKSTHFRYGMTYFDRYFFIGVTGNSLKIESSGATQKKGQKSAKSDSSFNKTFLLERADDGAFYFVPENIKGDGYFKISRSVDSPTYYSVTLVTVPQ